MRGLRVQGLLLGLAFFAVPGVAQREGAAPRDAEVARIGSKPLTEWLEEWRAAPPEQRNTMLETIAASGRAPNRAAYRALPAFVQGPDFELREAACGLLRYDHEDAATIAAVLEPALADPNVRVQFRAATSLINCAYPRPKAGYDVLLRFARGDDAAFRLEAVQQLGSHVRVEPRAVDLMLELAGSADLEFRRAAFSGLLSSDDERTFEPCRAGLFDADEGIRDLATRKFVYAGRTTDEVASVVVALARSTVDGIRMEAANLLGQFGAERASEAVPLLLELLRDTDSFTRGNAATALGNLGNEGIEAPEAAPALIELTQDANVYARGAAAWALGHVGIGADIAVPALAKLVQDPNREARSAAIESLRQAGPDIVLALPQLIAALENREPWTRECAAQLIALGGPAAKDAVPPLTRRLADPLAIVRLWTAYALREIGGASATALPELTKMLAEDPDPKARVEAARTLAAIGPLAAAACDALIAATHDPDVEVRLWSLFALGETGVKSESVLAALQADASSADERVAIEANKALAKLGETHDETKAAATASAPPPPPETLSAPIGYDGLALVLVDDHGAALVDFLDESSEKTEKSERGGVKYRYRYLAKGQDHATAGTGEAFAISQIVAPNFGVEDSAASHSWIDAGPLRVGWSLRARGSGFVYWRPELLTVTLASELQFETLDLRRFIR